MKQVDVVETWTGPGKSDAVIVPLTLAENAAHEIDHRHYFEHWYFDARLEDGHQVVGFLQPSELVTRKPGVELHVYKPDGEKVSIKKPFPVSALQVSYDTCDVSLGKNRCFAETADGDELPTHRVHLEEEGVVFDLTFKNVIPGWKPGGGMTRYGDEDFFAWVVPAPKAAVTGTISYEGKEHEASGIGYHDHNWGIGDMKRIVDHWYWGRIYADDFTLLYAYVATTDRYGNARSTPLMLAHGEEIVLSTGAMELDCGDSVFSEAGNRDYPSWVTIKVPGELGLRLEVSDVIDAHDFIEDVPLARSALLKPLVNRLLGRPGYFRFNSDYTLRVFRDGEPYDRSGVTLHEMVALK